MVFARKALPQLLRVAPNCASREGAIGTSSSSRIRIVLAPQQPKLVIRRFASFESAFVGQVAPTEDDDMHDSEHCISAAGREAERRRKMIEEARTDNPFIAAQMSGGAVGAAEVAVRRYIRQGGLEDLEGAGKPLPYRAPPPYVDDAEHRIQGIIDRMNHERPDMEEGEWRATVGRASAADAAAVKNRNRSGGVR
mmetsp:Transcript_30054/g.75850  ORF Transcript_30054/g.75850 Transcript_30054/m.75850 type:complete len:195 (-) Transcript_30054:184-768(-)